MAKKAAKKAVKKASVKSVIKKAITKAVVKASDKINAKKPTFVKHETKLKAGDEAPFFEGIDQNGNSISLNDFAKKTLVLYFYPKDDTPGCTAEACSLRDEYTYLIQKEYAVVGVSKDDEKSHKKFATKFNIPFPLLADIELKAIKAYDVWGKKMFMGRVFDGVLRTTFIIKNKKIVRVITEVNNEEHAKQVLE